MTTSPQDILKDVFGYRNFRGDQRAIIEAALDGRDSLVIMPTGGGKSLCYQLPAILREGTGLVISPLIALMQDQVRALNEVVNCRGVSELESIARRGAGRNGQAQARRVAVAVHCARAPQHRAGPVTVARDSHFHDRD